MSDVHVKGLSELQKFLDQLPAKMEANVLRSALRAGAKVVAEDAKARCPVDTGRLRDSIRVSTKLRKGRVTASVKAGSKDTKKHVSTKADGGISVTYDNPWYAALVEFGTAAHYIKAVTQKALILRPNKRASSGFARRWTSWIVEGVHHPGAKPKPFMRPALDGKASAALVAVGEAIKKRLTKQGLDASGVELEVDE